MSHVCWLGARFAGPTAPCFPHHLSVTSFYTLLQVEFDFVQQCYGSVSYTTIGNRRQAPTFQLHPYQALKV